MKTQWSNSRKIIERIIVKGILELATPAHFGNGESGGLTDISLLRDPLDGTPLLTGASIAGALRNYLREYAGGYGVKENQDGRTLAEKLFGYIHAVDEASYESWLVVEDAHGKPPQAGNAVEIRDGVTIDPITRTAEIENGKGKKFDIELLAAGTTFELGFELWLTAEQHDELLEAFAIALNGLKEGHIHLGMRKRRGFGACRVADWQVSHYHMNKIDEVLAWLDGNPLPGSLSVPALAPQGEAFDIQATFRLDKSSLLIRSDSGEADAPDTVHLRSWRNGQLKPVLSGTSLAGVLRSRALRIANTLMNNSQEGAAFVDGIFGKRIRTSDDVPSGSLLTVAESKISDQAITNLVQNRVKIDRFTGGAFPGALFSQQPVFGKDLGDTKVTIKLSLRKRPANANIFDAQVGLLLLILKDLWGGDLPIGGESSVGRGRIQGDSASLQLGGSTWILKKTDEKLEFGGNAPADILENRYLKAFKEACHV
jgi:CRISPR/Cas system CSM-associated protein Csm3 (group 7 of RAMP superfamily)